MAHINKQILSHPVDVTYNYPLAFKFLLFWIFVSVGRPQDIYPPIAMLHLGDIAAVGSIGSLFATKPYQKNLGIFNYLEVKLVIGLFVLMLVLIPFSLVKSECVGFIKAIYLKSIIFFLILVLLNKTIKNLRSVSLCLLISLLSLSIVTFKARGEMYDRISIGSTYDPNDLAMILVTLLPMAIMYSFHAKGMVRLLGIGSAIMGILAITLTQSRGGFLGLATIIFFIFFSRSRFNMKYILILLALSIVILNFAPAAYWDRMSTINQEDQGSGRILIWKRGVRMLAKNPLGYGANNFISAYGRYIENDPDTPDESGAFAWKTAHNSFILIAVELGVLGLSLFLFLIYRTYKNFQKIKKMVAPNSTVYQYAEYFRISLVGFVVCCFFLSQAYASILLLIVAISSVMVNVIGKGAGDDKDKKVLNFVREVNDPVNHVHPVKKLL